MNAQPAFLGGFDKSSSSTPSGRTHGGHPVIALHHNIPHLAGNEASECLCNSCHLKLFPRRQDGKIMLPHPSVMSKPTTMRSERSSIQPRRQSISHSSGRIQEEIGAERPQHVHVDRGEGSSTGLRRRSATHTGGTGEINEPRAHLPPILQEFFPSGTKILIDPSSALVSAGYSEGFRQQPQNSKAERRMSHSITGASRRLQPPKPYDAKARRPEPLPRVLGIDEPPERLGLGHTPRSMARSLTSERKQLGLGPYGSPSAQSAVGYSSQFGDFGMAQRMTTQVQSIDQGNVPWTSSVDELGASSSNISHSERGHSETPQQQSRSGTPNDFLNPQGQPKLYRFSSRSQNPQPAVARSGGSSHFIPEDVKDTEQSSIPKQLYATPQDDIFPTGEPSQLEGGSSQPQDSMSRFRFQEPVMPQSHVVSPTNRQREFSIVHVKWDSDRKRRQGYFSQEDGAEKSPFRHYNKGKCDFEG